MVHLSHFKKGTKLKRIVIRLKLLPYLTSMEVMLLIQYIYLQSVVV